MRKINKGIFLALITAVISGFANFIAKVGVSIADPLAHTALRVSLAALVLTAIVYKKYELRKITKLPKADKLKLIMIGIVGGSLPFMMFFVGLSKTTALTGALIHKTLYIWVAILAIIFLKEKISIKQMGGYLLIFWSNQLLFSGAQFKLSAGEMLIFGATILWAIENIIAKSVLKKVPPLIVAWARLTIGGAIILTTSLLLGKGELLVNLSSVQALTIIAGAATLFFYVATWYTALSLAPATLVAALLVPATLITNILTGTFMTHTLSFNHMVSSILVITGIIIIIYFAHNANFLNFSARAAKNQEM